MLSLLMFLWFFFANSLFAIQSFYISEVFINKLGKGSNKGSFWLELHSLETHNILVSTLLIEIGAAGKEPQYRTEFSFPAALIFEEYLLLAEQENLGFKNGACFNKLAPILVLPDFTLVKAKALKICITINGGMQDCTTLKAGGSFPDGKALYRSFDGIKVQPWWLYEPCELSQGIYATPGLAARACIFNKDLVDELLAVCEQEKAKSKARPLLGGSPPMLTSLLEGALNIEDPDETDLWHLTTCNFPFGSKLICHQQAPPLSLQKNSKMPVKELSALSYYAVRDLYGHSAHLHGNKEVLSPKGLKNVRVHSELLSSHTLQLRLILEDKIVPLNYQIKDQHEQILSSGAWLSAGEKKLEIDKAHLHGPLTMELIGLREKHSQILDYQDMQNGCQTNEDTAFLLMSAILIIMAFKRRNAARINKLSIL